MKRILYVCLALMCGLGSFQAQNERLMRNVIATLETSHVVNPGEFQMELEKGVFYDSSSENPWFSFIYVASNRFNGTSNIMVNNKPKIVNREAQVRPYRIGPSLEKSIFILKNAGISNANMRHGMEVVLARNITHPVCDSVLYLNDDGYVFTLDGQVYYSLYKSASDNQSHNEQIVWLIKKNYQPGMTFETPAKTNTLSRLSAGDVFHESSEGHYYYLFRDQYMPYTVLVVDDEVIELHDRYDEDNFRFKYSYNGMHWMAVGNQCFWVDGVIKSVEGYHITDFVITNSGDYAYTASKIGEQNKGEVVVFNGQVIRRNADVCYFGMNGEGNLKIRFMVGGRYLQYENEKTVDVTDMMVSVYYPSDRKSRMMRVVSDDGSHKLTYRCGVPSVEIDGVKMADSEPCYAVFDQRNSAFIWNAVEVHDMKTELVIYRYAVPKKLFKKLFH